MCSSERKLKPKLNLWFSASTVESKVKLSLKDFKKIKNHIIVKNVRPKFLLNILKIEYL